MERRLRTVAVLVTTLLAVAAAAVVIEDRDAEA
jgi:hypothetical protein